MFNPISFSILLSFTFPHQEAERIWKSSLSLSGPYSTSPPPLISHFGWHQRHWHLKEIPQCLCCWSTWALCPPQVSLNLFKPFATKLRLPAWKLCVFFWTRVFSAKENYKCSSSEIQDQRITHYFSIHNMKVTPFETLSDDQRLLMNTRCNH